MTEGNLYNTGVRPAIDDYLLKQSQQRRDYGDYWPASSAGYCMRKVTFDRLQVPYTSADARKQRVFSVGHIFHAWIQDITKKAGLSVGQEVELISDELMVKGHVDDIIRSDGKVMVVDYKTQNSSAFSWQKGKPISYYHRMQVGTYMYMLRMTDDFDGLPNEGRLLKISKDDLRMTEQQLLWTPELEQDIRNYWTTLNDYWESGTIPPCTCADYENGFMAKPKFNPYYYQDEPCSIAWYEEWHQHQTTETQPEGAIV